MILSVVCQSLFAFPRLHCSLELRLQNFHSTFFQSENEPFYLHPPGSQHESSRRRRDEKEGRGIRESVRHSKSHSSMRTSQSHSHDPVRHDRDRRVTSSDGVRFSDTAPEPLHRSKAGAGHHSGDYNHYRKSSQSERYRTERSHRRYDRDRDNRKSSRRSHSVEYYEDDIGHIKDREKTHSMNYADHGHHKTSSRSKSYDSLSGGGERKSSSKEKHYEENPPIFETQLIGESGEGYAAPFYLHSAPSQKSSQSQHGYERIQSLFYGSSEQLERRDTSPRKYSGNKDQSKDRRKDRSKDRSKDRNNNEQSSRQRSPRRRAAPAMPLPGAGECVLLVADMQLLLLPSNIKLT